MAKLETLRMNVDARRRRMHARFMKALQHMTAGQAAAIMVEAEKYGTGGAR